MSGEQDQVDAAGQRHAALAVPQAWHARCTATSDDEHAVSTVMLGPAGRARTTGVRDARCARCRRRSRHRAAPASPRLELQVGIVAGRPRRRRRRCADPPAVRRLPGVLQRLPATSSSSRCCGSMPCGFARRDAEEAGIEARRRRRGTRRSAWRSCPARRRIRVVERVDVPAVGRASA